VKVSVIGAGHVGLIAGVCLAEVGHDVVCMDNDAERVEALRNGKAPFYEPYLQELLEANNGGGKLVFTTELADAVKHAEVIFLCVGTPPLPDGEADLSTVERVSRQIATLSDGYTLVVEKSTVPVLTGTRIHATMQTYSRGRDGVEFEVASNPEFLSEGTAVQDYLFPDRIVIGVESKRAESLLREVYAPIVEQSFTWRPKPTVNRPPPRPMLMTNRSTAEIIKHASNSFLATKISYINMVARLCDEVGADVAQVAEGMGLDRRIGPHFLNSGIGFGGFCFPKDLQAFVAMAERSRCDFGLLKKVEAVNQQCVAEFITKVKKELWVLKGKRIGVWGLAFKANTDDMRFSPAAAVVEGLLEEGAEIRAYDPCAMDEARKELPQIEYADSAETAAADCDALVILTEWPEFRKVDLMSLREKMLRPLILDGRNLLDPKALRDLGFEYVSIGRP